MAASPRTSNMLPYDCMVVDYLRVNGVFLHTGALWWFNASTGASEQIFPLPPVSREPSFVRDRRVDSRSRRRKRRKSAALPR